MLLIRSLAFNALFYLNLVAQMILWSPYYFLSPRHRAWLFLGQPRQVQCRQGLAPTDHSLCTA